jgi:hypothetical protein
MVTTKGVNMITKNERIATKAYERLVKPMMERYN